MALTKVTSGGLTDDSIVNADINSSAAIALSKLATDPSNASNLASGTVPDARFTTLPAVSGVNLTSLNASNLGSGTVPAARLSGLGKVIQIIYNSSIPGSAVTTTSTSFVDTGLECTITPTSADNKILLVAAFGDRTITSGGELATTFYVDDTTNLGNGSYGWSFYQGAGSSYYGALTMVQVHAPASTSSIDYSVYFKSDNGSKTATAYAANTGVTMLAMEIDGTAE